MGRCNLMTGQSLCRYHRSYWLQTIAFICSSAYFISMLQVGSGKLVYTFGSTSVVLNIGKVHDGEWHNATVSVTGQ